MIVFYNQISIYYLFKQFIQFSQLQLQLFPLLLLLLLPRRSWKNSLADKKKIIVAPPSNNRVKVVADKIELPCVTFLYAAAPDCHKNFEVICRAAGLLEKELGSGKFKVIITAKGDENA